MARKTTIITISLPNNLLQELDAVKAEEYRNRSDLVAASIRLYLRARTYARQEIEHRFKTAQGEEGVGGTVPSSNP
jgi:metal-responsive CopG/Arc/MetJ family transcriptional regulator